ncbi:MAG: NAD-dependent epimerase/dehydratase family protein [Myxococcota bacterium]
MRHVPELRLSKEALAPLGRCLVTGGAGYLGRCLAEALLAAGREVRLLDVRRHATTADLEAAGAEMWVGDVRDPALVARACEGIDTVFHAAAIIDGRTHVSEAARARSVGVNVEGTRNVIAGARAAGTRRLVHTSSVNVVFDGRPIANGAEDTPYASEGPLDLYTETKLEAEKLVLGANGPELATVALRPGGIFGPYEETHLPRLTKSVARGYVRAIIGPGTARADNVYIDDLVDASLRAALALAGAPAGGTGDAAGKAYFVSDGEPKNYFAYAGPLMAQLGQPFPTLSVPPFLARPGVRLLEELSKRGGPYPPMSLMELEKVLEDHYFDPGPAERDFGFRAQVGHEETWRRCANWVAEIAERTPVVTRPHVGWWIGVGTGLGLTFLLAFDRRAHRAASLFVPGFGVVFPRRVLKGIAAGAAALHIGEGIYAYRLAKRSGLEEVALDWGLQTLALGWPSLRLLRREVARRAR